MARRLIALVAMLVLAAGGGSALGRAHHHVRHHRSRHHHRVHRHRPHPPAPKPVRAPLPTPPLWHLQVPEREFSLSLSHPELPAGRAIIEAVNFGEDPHDLRIARVDSTDPAVAFPILQPSQRASRALTLQPGTYRLWCALAGHDALGMHATLVVR